MPIVEGLILGNAILPTIHVFVVGNLVILLRIVQIILTKGTPQLEVDKRGLWSKEEFLPPTEQDAQAAPEVVLGTLNICSKTTHVLFDSGSSHSFTSLT